jgi:hypothetical protein
MRVVSWKYTQIVHGDLVPLGNNLQVDHFHCRGGAGKLAFSWVHWAWEFEDVLIGESDVVYIEGTDMEDSRAALSRK